ncbi:mercuric transport protein MerTP [Polaribacter marinaquae]|jgi:copper chaperone CopZ|uniref:Mercuric transport protein MerT n=1 Tax=Polaribacter marinaquae TaxID=1642819 RepID=A0ABZ2TUA8_9FLAO
MKTEKTSKNAAYTGLFAAVAASSCCIPPVIALIAGVGGSASALSWMEPFRPYLIGLAIVAIGYAWYNYLKPKNADDCGCEVDAKPKWFQTKGFLIGITLFAAVSIAFPYYAHIFYPDNKKEVIVVNQSNIQTLKVDVKGMTCVSCEDHVKHAVNELDGIVNVAASYEKENAEIKYDSTKTSKEDIEKAINATGYTVTNKLKDE